VRWLEIIWHSVGLNGFLLSRPKLNYAALAFRHVRILQAGGPRVIIAPEIHRNLRHVFSSWNEVSRWNGELNSHGEDAYGSAARTHRLLSRRTPDYIDIRPDILPPDLDGPASPS
jgi:hypothetical protein